LRAILRKERIRHPGSLLFFFSSLFLDFSRSPNTIRSISFGMRVTVPPETLVNVVGNETVIMSLESQAFFGLDKVGTNMWKALTRADSISGGL
jgi:hypothetical protein